jgi:isocitrate dehydrogenase
MGMYNFNQSIEDFAAASFAYGLQREYPVYLSTKNTILKAYDGAFKDIFADVFEREFKADFDAGWPHLRAPPHRRHGRGRDEVGGRLRLGVQELRRRRAVRHRRPGLRLARPDDLGADDARTARPWRPRRRTARSPATTASTSRASPPRPTRSPRSSPGPAASSTAASSTARPEVTGFAETLERVCVETVESGKMTKDLALLVGADQDFLTTEDFLAALDENLRSAMQA